MSNNECGSVVSGVQLQRNMKGLQQMISGEHKRKAKKHKEGGSKNYLRWINL